jgi:hypothetical protein
MPAAAIHSNTSGLAEKQDCDTAVPATRLSVLLICDDQRGHANTVLDHIAALSRCSRHDVRVFNPCGMAGSRYLDLEEFDVVVLHYSLVIISDHYLSPAFQEQIRRFTGLKIQFLQDEYRWVDAITAKMRDLGIHVLFTLLQPERIAAVYDDRRLPGVHKITTLAGYVPDYLARCTVPPLAQRPIDIGYRGRTLPYWLGRLAQEKVWIAQGVLSRAPQYNLKCDIGWREDDRIYGQRWIDFIASCRATLGTESGASITDFDGMLEKRTKAYLAEAPTATFEDVTRDVIGPYDGIIPVTAISPRVLEAAALRTALILFPGEYSGAIRPWEHYIPLAKDFSNMDEVVNKLRDVRFLEALTDRAYLDLVASGRYSQRALTSIFDETVSRYGRRTGKRRKLCYRLASLERPCAVANMKAKTALRPYLLIPQNIVKASSALVRMLAIRVGRKTLWAFVKEPHIRQTARFGELLRDVLKLAVVGQVPDWRRSSTSFEIRCEYHRERGALVLISQPLPAGRQPCACVPPTLSLEQIRSIVWNHSAVGGMVRYRLWPIGSLAVCVGDYDLHTFEGLLEFARCRPKLAWKLFEELLRCPAAAMSSTMEAPGQ